MLMAGFDSVLAGLEDCRLSGVFTVLELLMEHVRTCRPSVVLVDVTGYVTMSILSKLTATADVSPVVLWVESASTEFASEALVSAGIKHPQYCRFCRSAPPSTWAGTR